MKLYGISNCDTVRKARKYLETNNATFDFIDFRKDGLSSEDIQRWLEVAEFTQVVNKRSTSWRTLNDEQKAILSSDNASNEAINLLIEQPTLIKRPVLVTQDKVLFGFKEADYNAVIA